MLEVIEITVYANLIPLLCLVALLPLIKGNHLFNHLQGKRFVTATVINIVMLVVISAGYAFEESTFGSAWVLRTVTSYLNFVASPLIPLFLYKIFSLQKDRLIFYIPMAINAVICTHSIFWPTVFTIDETNSYSRGPLFFLPFATSMFYVLALIIRTKAYHRREKCVEVLFLWIVVLVQLTCISLEVYIGFRFLTWDAAAIMLALYYLLININNTRCDPMTGAFNRAVYNKQLAKIQSGKHEYAISVIDLNNFKRINDEFGHEAGDKCLITLVGILQKHCDDNATVYRIGGDEFAIISAKWDLISITMELDKMLKAANTVDIDFAYGVSMYHPGESIEAAIFVADKSMYLNKNAKKALGAGE